MFCCWNDLVGSRFPTANREKTTESDNEKTDAIGISESKELYNGSGKSIRPKAF